MSLFNDILPVAATAVGGYFGGPTGAMIGSQLGSALAGSQAQGQAQQAAGNVAQGLQFKPFGTTNTFGTSNFGYDPTTGKLTSAGYSLSPFLSQYQNALTGTEATTQNLNDLNSQLGLARSYLSSTPQELGKNWITSQLDFLQPSRDKAWADVANKNFAGGTTGLSVAQGGSLQAANPLASAVANAQAMQDLQLASQAQTQGQQQYLFGQGLLSDAYNPLKTALGTSSTIETMGQNPYALSTNLGAQVANQATQAAPWQYSATATSPTTSLLQGLLGNKQLISGIGGLFGGGGGSGVFNAQPAAAGATADQWWM